MVYSPTQFALILTLHFTWGSWTNSELLPFFHDTISVSLAHFGQYLPFTRLLIAPGRSFLHVPITRRTPSATFSGVAVSEGRGVKEREHSDVSLKGWLFGLEHLFLACWLGLKQLKGLSSIPWIFFNHDYCFITLPMKEIQKNHIGPIYHVSWLIFCLNQGAPTWTGSGRDLNVRVNTVTEHHLKQHSDNVVPLHFPLTATANELTQQRLRLRSETYKSPAITNNFLLLDLSERLQWNQSIEQHLSQIGGQTRSLLP